MPEPSAFVDWDTNGTHVTPVTSGHMTDGFAEDEIPDSDEVNQWMMLVGLWVRYLYGLITGAYSIEIPIMPGQGFVAGSGSTTPSGPISSIASVEILANSGGTNEASWLVGVQVPKAVTITGARVQLNVVSTPANADVNFNLYASNGLGSTTLVASAASTGTGFQTIDLGTLSYNTAALKCLYLVVAAESTSGTAAEAIIYAMEMDILP